MIYLTPNTAGQIVRLSLDEGRQYFSTTFTYYLFVLTREENATGDSGDSVAQVLSVSSESERITVATCTTVGLTTPGRYRYEVYGQNSAVNTDPDNAAVVGLVERGLCILTDSTTYYDVPTITIQNDIIAGQ